MYDMPERAGDPLAAQLAAIGSSRIAISYDIRLKGGIKVFGGQYAPPNTSLFPPVSCSRSLGRGARAAPP
jgi:hypothetical protein